MDILSGGEQSKADEAPSWVRVFRFDAETLV